MKRWSPLLWVCSLAALLTAGSVSGQTSADPALLRDLANQDRAHAADARQRAQQWADMAAKARARAASSTGALRDSWLQSAQDDENSANQLNNEANDWEQKARDLDAEADAAEKAARTNQPAPAASVATAPPATTEKPGQYDELTDILGQWIDQSRHNTTITIERQNPTARDNALILKGKHGDWKGTYTPANGSQPAQVAFRRKPGWQEMDAAAPPWARQQAEGKLEWILELDVQGCMPRLTGKWYRGEVRWRADGAQTATSNSHVDDLPADYARIPAVDLPFSSTPGIQVVTRRDLPWPAESLDRDQGFFVEVRLSYDDAKVQGPELPVKISAPRGHSMVVTLTGAPHKGRTVYTTDASIIFDKPFSIAGPSDLVYSPADSINLEKLALHSGDLVTVSLVPQKWGDVSTSFHFYDTWVQQGIARNDAAFFELAGAYKIAAATSTDENARQILNRKLQFIDDARYIINDYHPKPERDQLTDLQRYYIGQSYHALLLTDTYTYRIGPGTKYDAMWRSGPYSWDRIGRQLVCSAEATMVSMAMEEGREKFKEEFMHAVPAGIALGLYHIVAQLTGGSQMWMAVYGVNEDGHPVDLSDRVFAGAGFVSSALFSVASSKYLTDLSPEAASGWRAASSPGERPVDDPVEETYAIDPDSAATIKRTVEGGPVPGKIEDLDINLLRQVYGPNARLRPIAAGGNPILQINNRNCLLAVTRVHIFKGDGRQVPEMSLRSAAAIGGFTEPGAGTLMEGYVFLIQHAGGKAAIGEVGMGALKAISDANYFIAVSIQAGTIRHAIDFRGFVNERGQDLVIFGDPYVGQEVLLPVCDFKKIFIDPTTGKGLIAVSDFGQAQPIQSGGRTIAPLH